MLNADSHLLNYLAFRGNPQGLVTTLTKANTRAGILHSTFTMVSQVWTFYSTQVHSIPLNFHYNYIY